MCATQIILAGEEGIQLLVLELPTDDLVSTCCTLARCRPSLGPA